MIRALRHFASKQALHSECIWLNLIDLQFWNREKLMKHVMGLGSDVHESGKS